MLIDTSVWLDLARDSKQAALLGVLEEMLKHGLVSLVVPTVVLDEFSANRERIATESAKSLSTHFRLVRDAVGRMGGNKRRLRNVLKHLDDVDHKIPILGGAAVQLLDRIEKLLKASPVIEPTEQVKLAAAQRAIDGRAPFRQGKNAMADAILVETFAECFRKESKRGVRFAFVTHNKIDFSWKNVNDKMPHPDFGFFSRVKCRYFISLAEALRVIEPSLVTDIMFEQDWTQEPRGLTEILEAEELLFNQVWYNRHWNARIGIEQGTIKLVDAETYPRPRGGPETILRSVWKGALASARKVQRRYGNKNLGPWDDFEWGMINGKLSALRWVLGNEWDMLDT
jgi:hypothetical protein